MDPILVANLTSDFPGLAYHNYSDIIVSTLLIIQDFNWLFVFFIIFFFKWKYDRVFPVKQRKLTERAVTRPSTNLKIPFSKYWHTDLGFWRFNDRFYLIISKIPVYQFLAAVTFNSNITTDQWGNLSTPIPNNIWKPNRVQLPCRPKVLMRSHYKQRNGLINILLYFILFRTFHLGTYMVILSIF